MDDSPGRSERRVGTEADQSVWSAGSGRGWEPVDDVVTGTGVLGSGAGSFALIDRGARTGLSLTLLSITAVADIVSDESRRAK
jgi:hypothetical protein